MMSSPRRRSLRHRYLRRSVALVGALALLAACSTSVAGSAQPAVVATGAVASSSGATGPGGQITEPSVLPSPSASPSGSSTSGTSTSRSGGVPSTGAVPGPVPKGLEKFYDQQLSWGACSGFATGADSAALYKDSTIQCARLTVPLAYADPTGPAINVGVLRKVATDPAVRIGSLITDPGGPGGSGMTWLASYVVGLKTAKPTQVQVVTAELNKKFDLVGIDPRGVGSSLPAVQCQTDPQKDAFRTNDTRSRNQSDVDAANALTRQIVAQCLANTGSAQGIDGKTFLANIGTRDVAKDLDVLRAVLGDRKLSYLGFSYGTQIGWVYAEQFPANVRAILFDGDVSPIGDPATEAIGQQKGFQAAFVNFAAWCAQNSPSCALGTDPSQALTNFQALVRPLLSRHLPLSDGRVLSFGDAITGVTYALYFDQYRTALAKGLLNLQRGNGDILMALADVYDSRDSSGHYTNETDAFNAVRCVDGPRMTDPAQVTKFNADYAAAGQYGATGDPAGAVMDICAYWPVQPTLLPHRLTITGLPKTLVISTTGDPATPYENGVELAKEIGATLLTVKGVRHTAFLTNGITCVDSIGTAYLESLTLPSAGTTCQ